MIDLCDKAKWVRRQALEMAAIAGEGHVTSAYSCIDIIVALYSYFLRFDPKNPKWPGRDRFILSKGQASLALYPVLADAGFFPVSDLMTFCKKDSKLGIHVECQAVGEEIVSGSLGQGLSIATGMALALKMNRELPLVFCLVGDGECYEGQIWEAAMFAAHNRLNNLITIVDRNRMCCTDFTENILSLGDMAEKWKAFGWETREINGHDCMDMLISLSDVRNRVSTKPLCIIANTVKGKGVSFTENVPLWHGVAVMGEELDSAREELK